MCYNLLEEAWLPVLTNDGYYKRLNIIDTLQHAATIRQLAPSNPMDRFAVFRFLLALCYWCADRTGVPFPHNSDVLPQRWLDYLEQRRDCFNLLGEGKRFYQVTGTSALPTSAKKYTAELFHEIPTQSSKLLFRHSIESEVGICLGCCALGLIRLPDFALPNGCKESPGINKAPSLYWAFQGASLLRSLEASYAVLDSYAESKPESAPTWDSEDSQHQPVRGLGILEAMTWNPRWVWLNATEESMTNGVCAACGEEGKLITKTSFFGKGGLYPVTSNENKSKEKKVIEEKWDWFDPFVLVPARFDDKIANISSAIFRTGENADALLLALKSFLNKEIVICNDLRLWVVNLAAEQANTYEAREFMIPLTHLKEKTSSELSDDLDSWITNGSFNLHPERWESQLPGELCVSICEKMSSEKHDHEKDSTKKCDPEKAPARTAYIAQLARPHVEEQVARNMSKLLAGESEYTWDDAANEYQSFMRAAAKSLAPQDTVEDAQKRRRVEQIRPAIKQEGKNDG